MHKSAPSGNISATVTPGLRVARFSRANSPGVRRRMNSLLRRESSGLSDCPVHRLSEYSDWSGLSIAICSSPVLGTKNPPFLTSLTKDRWAVAPTSTAVREPVPNRTVGTCRACMLPGPQSGSKPSFAEPSIVLQDLQRSRVLALAGRFGLVVRTSQLAFFTSSRWAAPIKFHHLQPPPLIPFVYIIFRKLGGLAELAPTIAITRLPSASLA